MATVSQHSQPSAHKKPRGLSRLRRREAMWGILCVAPAVLGFVLWQLGPIIASLFIAFTDWGIAGNPEWIGAENFRKIFTEDKLFFKSLGVTFYYALGSVPLRMLAAFLLAVLLNQKLRALPIFRTIFYLPSVVPVIASSVLWIWLFNPDFGLLNAILTPLGFQKSQWIYNSSTVIPSFIFMSLWDRELGPMMIIFLAGLQGVPRELYEAAEIDGGNAWHKMRYITLPMVTPTIFFNLVLSMINTLQTFVQPYAMTEGGPNNASLMYVLYLYQKAFEQSQMGYASALAWIMFVIIALLSLLVFRSSSLWVYYGGR